MLLKYEMYVCMYVMICNVWQAGKVLGEFVNPFWSEDMCAQVLEDNILRPDPDLLTFQDLDLVNPHTYIHTHWISYRPKAMCVMLRCLPVLIWKLSTICIGSERVVTSTWSRDITERAREYAYIHTYIHTYAYIHDYHWDLTLISKA